MKNFFYTYNSNQYILKLINNTEGQSIALFSQVLKELKDNSFNVAIPEKNANIIIRKSCLGILLFVNDKKSIDSTFTELYSDLIIELTDLDELERDSFSQDKEIKVKCTDFHLETYCSNLTDITSMITDKYCKGIANKEYLEFFDILKDLLESKKEFNLKVKIPYNYFNNPDKEHNWNIIKRVR